MNQEIKAQWIEALRSGKYAQGQYSLRSDTGYCCLGVLCDIHAKAGLGKWADARNGCHPYNPNGIQDIGNTNWLPPVVMEWAGLNEVSPVVAGKAISLWNDGAHMAVNGYVIALSFPQIADMIEREL